MIHRPEMHKPEVKPEDEDFIVFCRKNRMGQLWYRAW
jgi:hypothetical protein